MILLLGEPNDPVLSSVHAELSARRADVHATSRLFGEPSRFRWTVAPSISTWELEISDGRVVREPDLCGVLVRRAPWLDPERWGEADRAYAFCEASAAALAWLWSLRCLAVGRLPAGLHYRPSFHLLDWAPDLAAVGLRPQAARITNDLAAARAFAGEAAAMHLMGPDVSYLVSEPAEWEALGAHLGRAPALLTRLHGPVRMACVLGGEVHWSGGAAPELEAPLLALARRLRVDFLEVAFAREPQSDAERVVGVDPLPRLERFEPAARHRVVARLCDRLLAPAPALEMAS